MTTLVTFLTNGFADWETALINAATREFFKGTTRFVTLDGQPVVSSGGMRVVPDGALADVDFAATDALLICGGTIWSSPNAPDIAKPLQKARDKGIVVAGICEGVSALAKSGLLDTVAHTGNQPGCLDPTGYAGKAHYRNQPQAVRDGKIVTAPGTAPVTFMAEVLNAIGLGGDNLNFYVRMYASEHNAAA
jgi:putative intracellular protease/amidase